MLWIFKRLRLRFKKQEQTRFALLIRLLVWRLMLTSELRAQLAQQQVYTGAAIKPLTLRLVWQVAQVVSIPVIGCGGVTTGKDAVEYLIAGATAGASRTALFNKPLVLWNR